MGIFDKIFGRKSKDLKIRDVSIEKGGVEKKITVTNIEELVEKKDVEGLIKALKDKDINVRDGAAEALCKVGDERAVEPLTEALLKDKAWEVRRYAAEALGNIGVPEVVAPLTAALNNDPYICNITGRAVVRLFANSALMKIERTKSATTPLERLLTCQWSSPSPSQEVTALTETLRRNCKSISDRDISQCLDAIKNLSKTKDPVVTEVLCYTALVASHYKVRNSSAYALKTMTDSEIIQILCEALHYDRQVNPLVFSDWTLPTYALNTLEIVIDTSARGAIVDFLNDFRKTWSMKGDTIVTGVDMFTLGAQLDSEKSICISACRALAALGGSDAVIAIKAVLSDPYWSNYYDIRKELPNLIAKANHGGGE